MTYTATAPVRINPSIFSARQLGMLIGFATILETEVKAPTRAARQERAKAGKVELMTQQEKLQNSSASDIIKMITEERVQERQNSTFARQFLKEPTDSVMALVGAAFFESTPCGEQGEYIARKVVSMVNKGKLAREDASELLYRLSLPLLTEIALQEAYRFENDATAALGCIWEECRNAFFRFNPDEAGTSSFLTFLRSTLSKRMNAIALEFGPVERKLSESRNAMESLIIRIEMFTDISIPMNVTPETMLRNLKEGHKELNRVLKELVKNNPKLAEETNYRITSFPGVIDSIQTIEEIMYFQRAASRSGAMASMDEDKGDGNGKPLTLRNRLGEEMAAEEIDLEARDAELDAQDEMIATLTSLGFVKDGIIDPTITKFLGEVDAQVARLVNEPKWSAMILATVGAEKYTHEMAVESATRYGISVSSAQTIVEQVLPFYQANKKAYQTAS